MTRKGDGSLCSMVRALRATGLRLSVYIRYKILQSVQTGSIQAQSKICIRDRNLLVVPSGLTENLQELQLWNCLQRRPSMRGRIRMPVRMSQGTRKALHQGHRAVPNGI